MEPNRALDCLAKQFLLKIENNEMSVTPLFFSFFFFLFNSYLIQSLAHATARRISASHLQPPAVARLCRPRVPAVSPTRPRHPRAPSPPRRRSLVLRWPDALASMCPRASTLAPPPAYSFRLDWLISHGLKYCWLVWCERKTLLAG